MSARKYISEYVSPRLGCDPEIFLLKGGKVVGAEKVIPETGLMAPSTDGNYRITEGKNLRKSIVLDGVQVELNPAPQTCRALLGNEISAAFKTLKKHLAKMDGVSASFSQCVDIDAGELASLSDKSKALGCAPSDNIYNAKATIGVDPNTYTKRSAGGHIHIGLDSYPIIKEHRLRLVPLMDIFVGNTAVLMDRDPGNAVRRKVYGRAGEHRLPKHGLEYRTLSNFWLRSYPLMSGVMGLTRLACNILAYSCGHVAHQYGYDNKVTYPIGYDNLLWEGGEAEILKTVDLEKVQRAINDNDVELAKENFKAVRAFIMAHCESYYTGITPTNMLMFEHFVKRIDEEGIEYWFPDDPMTAWTDKYGKASTSGYGLEQMDGHGSGWEGFLSTKVVEDIAKPRKVRLSGVAS